MVQPEIIKYLNKYYGRLSKEQMAKELMLAGFEHEDITETLIAYQNDPLKFLAPRFQLTPDNSRFLISILTTITVILSIGLLGTVGYLFYFTQLKNEPAIIFIHNEPSANQSVAAENGQNPGVNGINEEEKIVCAMDVMDCPDGSYVSRIPPSCEFAECPEIKESACVKEGEYVDTISKDSFECCAGLVKTSALPMDENCEPIIPEGSTGIEPGWTCLACGDGYCNPEYENICNCPEDCGEKCVKEGEIVFFENVGKEKVCCEGLILAVSGLPSVGDCHENEELFGFCINCGDGVCGPVEDICNCPEDCKKETGISD